MMRSLLLLLTILTGVGVNAQQSGNLSAKSDLEEAARLNLAAVKLYKEGKYEKAFSPARRALEIRERLLKPDDHLVISAIQNLAEIQLLRNNPREAGVLYERVLKSYEGEFGPDNSNLIRVLNRLAVAYYRAGDSDMTEKIFIRALAIGEKSLAPDHPDLAASVFNLAEFYQFQGEYKKAEPLYRRLIAIREKSNASEEDLMDARERYACLLRKTNRETDALELEGRFPGFSAPVARDPGSGGVVNGRAIRLVQPPYPQIARARHISGTVTVRVLINEKGTVIRACAIDGPSLLLKAAESAARQSRFGPTLLSGSPVKVNGLIIYNFQ